MSKLAVVDKALKTIFFETRHVARLFLSYHKKFLHVQLVGTHGIFPSAGLEPTSAVARVASRLFF
jgi:hypothetical protein